MNPLFYNIVNAGFWTLFFFHNWESKYVKSIVFKPKQAVMKYNQLKKLIPKLRKKNSFLHNLLRNQNF